LHDLQVGWRPRSRIEGLLAELCELHGYCLTTEQRSALASEPPIDARTFIAQVLRLEGRELALVSKQELRRLEGVAERWIDGTAGSGLPLV